ncbi:MAG: BrnA antitoxin family protein [Terriglobales bacterium]
MTVKKKKAKRRKVRSLPAKLGRVRALIEEELLSLAEEERGAEARWNRPRKRRISLRVDAEVVDWFKSKGPGGKKRTG